ncbi:MAG: outer membrane protein assembly factor BamE [Oxalobacter sp.]|nr:MAG: outer membrane protein assembly factor BamE [Oxalobacter sp.]
MLILLGGCKTLNAPPPAIGMSEQAVIEKSGEPSKRYQDGNDRLLEYSGYWGQQTYMARFGSDGRLKSWEQVLTSPKFATVKLGETTKQQVLLTFGTPAETMVMPFMKYEVWSYRFKENDVWNSLMHIHFDQAGVVRMMYTGPDPQFDDTRRGR